MKTINMIRRLVVGAGGALALTLVLAAPSSSSAGECACTKAKPYTLKVCAVTGEKLPKDSAKAYAFDYQGEEVKLCCKGCLDDFNAHPSKYMTKLHYAEARAALAASKAGWTLQRDGGLFARGDAPSRWDWR